MFFKDKLKLVKLPVSRILPNPAQPRKDFDQAALESLAQSIKENGLLQPVTVRRENGGYTLIAGERRLRACKLAGLKEIPAIVTECAPEDSAVLALLENLQRKDLQMFEQANALVNLLREWHITQEEAAKRLGISQSYLANKLRLLKLSPEEQSEILSTSSPSATPGLCCGWTTAACGRGCCARWGRGASPWPRQRSWSRQPSSPNPPGASPSAPLWRRTSACLSTPSTTPWTP